MVQNETDNYRMTYTWYHEYTYQPAADSMGDLGTALAANNSVFSTSDQDNDNSASNCAAGEYNILTD